MIQIKLETMWKCHVLHCRCNCYSFVA